MWLLVSESADMPAGSTHYADIQMNYPELSGTLTGLEPSTNYFWCINYLENENSYMTDPVEFMTTESLPYSELIIGRWKSSDGNILAVKAVNGNKYAPGFSTPENSDGYISNARPVIDDDWCVTYSNSSTWDGSSSINLRVQEKMTFQTGRDELWPFPYKEFIANSAIPSGYNNPGYPPLTK